MSDPPRKNRKTVILKLHPTTEIKCESLVISLLLSVPAQEFLTRAAHLRNSWTEPVLPNAVAVGAAAEGAAQTGALRETVLHLNSNSSTY